MSDFVKDFISSAKKQFLKNKKYIEENDWTYSNKPSIKNKTKKQREEEDFDSIKEQQNQNKRKLDEFNLQNDLASGILERVKYFVKKTSSIKRTKQALDFIRESLAIVELHTNRVDFYINNMDISEIEESSMRADEVAFHNHCFKSVSKILDGISTLDVNYDDENNSNTSGIEFLNNAKAPLSMHKVLSKIYPQINKKLEEMGIDFESKPPNTMLILDPNPPVWDTNLHYFEQDKSTLQYYVDEFKKLEYGIIIDDVYISPWAYYHMNVFITPIPHKVWDENSKKYISKDFKINPPLRDSDWMIFENRVKQIADDHLIMFIAATRRAAKTTAESSLLGHASTIGLQELVCAGSSTKDLNQIRKNFKTDNEYKNPAFAVPVISNDWKDKVEFGLRTKSNKAILLSTLNIINTDGGNNKEVFAGYTMDVLVYDEVMKSQFLESLEGALPALRGADGTIRCFAVLSGTGGSEELSADGWKVLADPETYDVMPMQWDILERGVPKEAITWEEDKAKPFGTFIPGQCRVDMPKIESTLADYLGKPESEALRKVSIKITDWVKAKEILEERRLQVAGDKIKHQKEVVYAPLTPSDIFLSGALNPFPVAEAKAHKQYLLETGKWDKRRTIYKDSQGNICFDVSNKHLADFPHKGGNVDAPLLIFEDPPKEPVKWGTYTAGFDDYKHDDSESSSVATFYVFKNEMIGDDFSKKIVASLSFRPDRHSDVHEKWLMLMEAYQLNRTCFGENEDFAIKDFLDKRHKTDNYLAQSLDFSQTFNLPNNLKRKYGWSPQTSKKTLFRLFVEYCNEEFIFEKEDGSMVSLKGVQRIDDIGLLDEIIQYNENLNVDRITAAMGAIGYAHYLVSSFLFKPPTVNQNNNTDKKQNKPNTQRTNKSFYSSKNRERNFYGNRRR
jgi:hypothetical protein